MLEAFERGRKGVVVHFTKMDSIGRRERDIQSGCIDWACLSERTCLISTLIG